MRPGALTPGGGHEAPRGGHAAYSGSFWELATGNWDLGSYRAPKGQPVKARGGTPGTTPHNVLCALKGHTGQGACGHRSPRWGEV